MPLQKRGEGWLWTEADSVTLFDDLRVEDDATR